MSNTFKNSELKLFLDGASRGNPGLAGAGAYLIQDNKVLAEHSFFLNIKTNNQAEYLALLLGLIACKNFIKNNNNKLTIISDSELLIKQINKIYKVKNPELKKLYTIANKLLIDIDYKAKHVLRSNNKEADKLANDAIDKRVCIQEKDLQVLHKYYQEVNLLNFIN